MKQRVSTIKCTHIVFCQLSLTSNLLDNTTISIKSPNVIQYNDILPHSDYWCHILWKLQNKPMCKKHINVLYNNLQSDKLG